jgi:hypothetical protein
VIRPIKLCAAATAAILSALASGCTTAPSEPSGYTPIPDAVLFAQITALPHITKIVNLSYSKEFGMLNGYSADIDTDGEAEPNAFIDSVFAILYQGKYGASISISITAPAIPKEGGPGSRSYFLLESTIRGRYGPQPGTGLPPANKPLPVADYWVPPSKW